MALRIVRGIAVYLIAVCASAIYAAESPNIVIILADDLGYGDPGCYNDASKIPTPSIDRLAAEGLRFTDAHTPSSVCSPTRYGLLTGRYCWRTELKSSVLWPWDAPLIKPDRLTLPAMLKQHGYRTTCIGKWHLGWNWATIDGSRINDTLPLGKLERPVRAAHGEKIDFTKPIRDGPTTRGFDSYFGVALPNFPPYCFIRNDRTVGIPTERKPESMFGLEGPMLAGWDLTKIMAALGDEAETYIDRHARERRDEPFFLYMPLTAPHAPIAPASPFIGKSDAGRYGDFVHEVDATVGRVLAALDRNGLSQTTLVIFTSDNGSPARDGTNMGGQPGSVVTKFGHDPSRPWRGMKADIWEAGHRVPFVVRWPGHTKAKTQSAELICLTDIMASVATIVGHKLPRDAAEDSYNILPLMRGESVPQPIRTSVVHHSHRGTFAMRDGSWKLIVGNLGSGGFSRPVFDKPEPGGPGGQLYNLAVDPAETNNLWSSKPEIVKRLVKQLDRIQRAGRSRS
jgi:arylsulfatase A-like enzyme